MADLAVHLFWVAGLLLALIALLLAFREARRTGERLRDRIKRRGYQAALMAAAALFCVGLGLTAGNTWERLLWLALAGLFLFQTAGALWDPSEDG